VVRTVTPAADQFALTVEQISSALVRPDITLTQVPAPSRLAPFALAMTAEPTDVDSDAFSGRFVLLHDPDGVEEWGGTFRAVIFARAELESDLLNDDLVREVAWSWILESTGDLEITELGGTVTSNFGQSFGTLADRPADGFVEVRSSWTPIEDASGIPLDNLGTHLNAWINILVCAGGLVPLPEGVAHVAHARRRG
jgi:hypothetical protein